MGHATFRGVRAAKAPNASSLANSASNSMACQTSPNVCQAKAKHYTSRNPSNHKFSPIMSDDSRCSMKFVRDMRAAFLMALAMFAATLAPGNAYADWRSWLFGPKDYEDCAENAAREAKSKDALAILLSSCELKFTARRKRMGGYTFYDTRQNRYFDVAGPNPNPAELEYIEKQYSSYVARQAELDRMFQEEEDRQREIRRVQSERQAAAVQAAKSQFQERQRNASLNVKVTSASVECTLSTTCGIYKLTVGIRNQSVERVSGVSLGWVFLPANEAICPTSLPSKYRQQVQLVPNATTTLNIDGHDGPSTNFRYCVMVTSVEIIP
jgi:hypothetical protein